MTEAPRGVVQGHRRCLECRYGLIGQPIFKDEGYEIFLVRCPECGVVAPAEEYPLLGRATAFWARGLAASYAAVVTAVWLFGGLFLFSLVAVSVEAGCSRYQEQVDQWYRDTFIQQGAVPGAAMPPGMLRQFAGNFQQWWQAEDRPARLAAMGGQWAALDISSLLLSWLPLLVASLVLGSFWAVVAYRRGPLGRLVVLVVVLLPTVGFSVLTMLTVANSQPDWSSGAALQQIGPTIFKLSLGFTAIATGIGILIGRVVARAVIRLTIPPDRRGALSLLWADHRAPGT